jgi:hypothetical protein
VLASELLRRNFEGIVKGLSSSDPEEISMIFRLGEAMIENSVEKNILWEKKYSLWENL